MNVRFQNGSPVATNSTGDLEGCVTIVKQGETLVVGLATSISAEQAGRMRERWDSLETGCRLIVLDDVACFAVIQPGE